MSTTTLRYERHEDDPAAGVVTVFLNDPEKPVTVLDRELLERLDATLDEIGEHPAGLVLASGGKAYLAGADLGEIQNLSDDDLDKYLAEGQRILGRIADLRCTSVAAINGTALGGGLELAMHCDALLAVEPEKPHKPYQLGLPEASLGLCPGWGGTNMLPARIEPGRAIGLAATGTTMDVRDAVESGLVESLHEDRDALLDAARRAASQRKPERAEAVRGQPVNISDPDIAPRVRTAFDRVQGDLPGDDACNAVLEAVQAGLKRGWREALKHERRELVRLRSTDRAREALKAFFERSGAKR